MTDLSRIKALVVTGAVALAGIVLAAAPAHADTGAASQMEAGHGRARRGGSRAREGRGQMSRAGFRRRLAAVSVAVTAAVLTAAGTVTPALTATGPSMDIDGNSVNIAVQGPDNSLLFYWAVNGSSTRRGPAGPSAIARSTRLSRGRTGDRLTAPAQDGSTEWPIRR